MRSHLTPLAVLGLALAIVPAHEPVFAQAMDGQAELSSKGKDSAQFVVVGFEELRSVMAEQLEIGYDPTATTNAARFQALIILKLARDTRASDANGPPLFVSHDDWFRALIEVNGLTEDEAPQYALLAYRHRQDLWVDYRPGRVIMSVEEGPEPLMALNVQAGWPRDSDQPNKYSFTDTLSTPTLKVTNHGLIRYRLLDFGDMIVFDKLQGLTGRPTSGLLAVLFKLIGEGRVVWSRLSFAEDGLQVTRAKAKKGPFSVTETLTLQLDGRANKGIPEDRPDLQALENRLKQKIKIKYHDWTLPKPE